MLKPDQVLIRGEGVYYLTNKADLEADKMFAIGILFHKDFGTWGYWHRNPETDRKEWLEIEVPEKDPALVHSGPEDLALLGDDHPLSEEDRQSAREIFAHYAKIFGGYEEFMASQKNSD